MVNIWQQWCIACIFKNNSGLTKPFHHRPMFIEMIGVNILYVNIQCFLFCCAKKTSYTFVYSVSAPVTHPIATVYLVFVRLLLLLNATKTLPLILHGLIFMYSFYLTELVLSVSLCFLHHFIATHSNIFSRFQIWKMEANTLFHFSPTSPAPHQSVGPCVLWMGHYI